MKALRSITLAASAVLLLCAVDAEARTTTFDRCLSRLTNDVLHFIKKRSQCTRACEDQVRKAKIGQGTDCGPASPHGPTAICHAKAVERLSGSRATARRVCKDAEIALFYGNTATCQGENQTWAALASCLQSRAAQAIDALLLDVYHPTRFDICGDGVLGPSEQCDPNAFPTCGSFTCHPQLCFCIPSFCGNGLLDPGEDCDGTAFPTGCSFFEFCDGSCTCRGFGSPAEAFLCDVPDLVE